MLADAAGSGSQTKYHPLGSALRHLLSPLLAALAFFMAQPASAQTSLIEDNASHEVLGPKSAIGAIIWSHGRSVDREDSLVATPSYIEAFRAQGWDAFRLNRERARDTIDRSSTALVRHAANLKARGYRRVVLAGQSFGAFISLLAADTTDRVDAVIAIAPAAFGPVAENPNLGALNASRLYPLLRRARRAAIMLFYFKDDIFEPGDRGPESEEILVARGKPYLVINHPAALESHWAGATREFASRFGSCIVAFASYGEAAAPACHAMESVPAATADSRTASTADPLQPRSGSALSGASENR